MTALSEQVHMTQDEARALYAEIAQRDATPQPGDVDRLARVLAVLGLTVGDYYQDVQALQEARQIEASMEDREALAAAMRQAAQARDAHEAETKRILAERETEHRRLDSEANAAYFALQRQGNRESDLKKLKARHRLAFGMEPKREPAPSGPRETIQTRHIEGKPAYRRGEDPAERPIREGEYEIQAHPW